LSEGSDFSQALAGDVEVLEEYHAKGFDIESCDCDGRTALMAAAWRGQRAALKTLLAGKCFPDKHDQEGRTALMIAAQSGQVQAVKELLAHGANPARLDLLGETAIDKANRMRHSKVAAALTDAAIWRPCGGRGSVVLDPLLISPPVQPLSPESSPKISLQSPSLKSPTSPSRAMSGVHLRLAPPCESVAQPWPACNQANDMAIAAHVSPVKVRNSTE